MIEVSGKMHQLIMSACKDLQHIKNNISLSFCVVLGCCVLVALGSLRGLITPTGYWLAWASILVLGWAGSGFKLWELIACRKIKILSVGFACLFSGLVVAGLVNKDEYTLFQCLKYVCIYSAFLIIYETSKKLSACQLLMVSRTTIGLAFVCFVLCKFVFKDFFVVLGDGREGSEFAYPGVMWKISAFFVGFILAKLLTASSPKSIDLLVIFIAIYLLFFDASRTGFLWFTATCIGIFMRVDMYRFIKLSLIPLVALIWLIFLWVAFNEDLEIALFKRLFQLDSVRWQMLKDGVINVAECVPWGCGFGSSSSMVLDQPTVVHNAYLATLADLGGLGFIGLLLIIVAPLYIYIGQRRASSIIQENEVLSFVAFLGALGYGFLMLLHPLSSELSEWGIWALMVSWQLILSPMQAGMLNET